MGVPMESLGNYIIHNAESHPINYSTHFTSDWPNLGSLLHGRRIAKGLDQFELVIRKFADWEEWRKKPEAVCEELQLLKVSMFPLSGEFSMNSHFTHTTSSECKLSLLMIVVRNWCFTNGFRQNALRSHTFQLTLRLLMRWDSQGTVLWTVA
jgi:hypothetical protein